MPPALATARSWNARSLTAAALPTTPTAINEHAARLHEPSKNETPTQLACPLRSRYVWSGGSYPDGAEDSPAGGTPTPRQPSRLAGRRELSRQQPERMYSSFEAYVVDGEVLDGETGWTSPLNTNNNGGSSSNSNRHYLGQSRPYSGGGGDSGSGGGGGGNGGNTKTAAGVVSGRGTGSSLRPGGRNNFFFGPDYSTLAGTAHAGRVEQAAAAQLLPRGPVDAKAASVLGVAGAVRGGVPSKARQLLGVGRRRVEGGLLEEEEEGEGEGRGPRADVLALQDAESADLSSSCAGSTSPRKDEAPPGFAPLGVDEDVGDIVSRAGSGAGAPATGGRGRASERGMTSARSDVQVAFPHDFEAGHPGGSGSAEADKARSSDSLGTKSGSTSLLSMMSGSPRSLGTAHSSGAGSPSPRTPLSDISSADEAAAAGGVGGSGGRSGGRREGASRGAAAAASAAAAAAAAMSAAEGNIIVGREHHHHDPWSSSGGAEVDDLELGEEGVGSAAAAQPRRLGQGGRGFRAVALAVEGRAEGIEEDDEADLPSAHPTPLSVFGSTMDLPSDHPTPQSTLGSTRRATGEGGGARRGLGIRTKTGSFGSGGSVKVVNPASSSFIQRLKYWGGGKGSADLSKDEVELALSPAAAATRARHSSGSSHPPADFLPAATAATESLRGRGGGSLGSRGQSPSLGFDVGSSRMGSRSVEPSDPPAYPGHGASSRSSRGGQGARTEMFDSVTSDAASAFAPASDQLWRATAPPRVSPLRDTSHSTKSSPAAAASTFSSSSSPSRQHLRVASGGSDADGFAAMAPLAVSTSKPTERDVGLASGVGSKSSERDVGFIGSGASKGSKDTASGSAGQKYSGFGAEHRAELAALRLARGTPAPGDEEREEKKEEEVEEAVGMGVGVGGVDHEAEEERAESVQSEMDWYSPSDLEEEEEEKKEELQVEAVQERTEEEEEEEEEEEVVVDDEEEEMMHEVAALTMAEKLANMATPHARGLGVGPTPTDNQHTAYQPASPPPPPPPRYMAIVDAASVHSGLDNSSTSEQDTSVSEDDGGMMAEILTDRLMEVCSKMEAAAAPPADELSDGEGGTGGAKRRPSRRRQMSNMSSSRTINKDQGAGSGRKRHNSFFSASGLMDGDDQGGDSDEGTSTAGDIGAVARKLRRDRLRKRARGQARKSLTSALTVPTNSKGEPILLHTAAYNGHMDALSEYISQGGDLEARDQFQATALMLCAERGYTEMVDTLLGAGADTSAVDENGNTALHLACFYGNREVVQLLLSVDVDVVAVDSEGRTPLDLSTDASIRRMVRTEEMVRMSGENFDLLEAVEVNDTTALTSFIMMGQAACGYPHKANAVSIAAQRLRLDRQGRGGMTGVHLAAFHGYIDSLRILLEGGAEPNATCDEGETPLHTACTGGSIQCATILLEYGANPLATDSNGLVPCEKHIAGGRQDMKRLLEVKAFQATPSNLLALRADLAEVSLQIDAEEDLFVRKGVAIKYLRKALKKKEADTSRLRQAVDARDTDIRNLRDRMDSVHRVLAGITVN